MLWPIPKSSWMTGLWLIPEFASHAPLSFPWSSSSFAFIRRPVNNTISHYFLFHNLELPITVCTYNMFSRQYNFGPSSSPHHLDSECCQLWDSYVLQTAFLVVMDNNSLDKGHNAKKERDYYPHFSVRTPTGGCGGRRNVMEWPVVGYIVYDRWLLNDTRKKHDRPQQVDNTT